eukprot:8548619-Pyramimonas_sp.AAC.1
MHEDSTARVHKLAVTEYDEGTPAVARVAAAALGPSAAALKAPPLPEIVNPDDKGYGREEEQLLAALGDPDLANRAAPSGEYLTSRGSGMGCDPLRGGVWKYRGTALPKVMPLVLASGL